MKEKILEQLSAVRMALGNVTVQGEQNCLNLGGAMQVLRDIQATLSQCEIQPPNTEKEGE